MRVKLQETTRQPRAGLSCPHFSGKSLCERRGRGQGPRRDTARGTRDHGKRGHPRQTKEPGSGGAGGPPARNSGGSKSGRAPLCPKVHRRTEPPGRRLAPSRGSRPRRPDRPLTRPCCHSGGYRYSSSGQRQDPDGEMPVTAWLCHRPQTESEIQAVLGQWQPEARLT